MSSWILISKKIPYLSPWNFSWVKPCLILNDIIFIVSNLYCIILSSFLLQQKFNTCMLYQVSVTASPDSLHNTTRVSFEKNSHFTLSLAQIVQYSSSAWAHFDGNDHGINHYSTHHAWNHVDRDSRSYQCRRAILDYLCQTECEVWIFFKRNSGSVMQAVRRRSNWHLVQHTSVEFLL